MVVLFGAGTLRSDDDDVIHMTHEQAKHRYSDATTGEITSFMTMLQSAHQLGVAPEPLGVVSKSREERGVVDVRCGRT